MMCRENFSFHFSCSLGLKSLSFHSQGSTTTFEKLCVKFIYKDGFKKIKVGMKVLPMVKFLQLTMV
jgi:hypothetical protein